MASESAEPINQAVLSILFSVDDFNTSIPEETRDKIDDFFDTALHNKTSKVVQNLKLGDVLENIHINNRWIYKAGQSFPPCERFVYWNVFHNIYPIKREHVDLIKKKLRQMGVKDTSGTNGNWR